MTQVENAIFRELETINKRLTSIENTQRKIETEIRRPRDNFSNVKEGNRNATTNT